MNGLYFGDNLDVLREHIGTASVDLVYLDPPFNSNASYGVLFKDDKGRASESQAEAFRDSWAWGPSAESAFDDVRREGGEPALLLHGLRKWLGETGLMAYVAMMAIRLIELRRVLKPSGSLYLHCDPTASHVLKLVLDAVFGQDKFLSEIIWKRTGTHSSARRWGPVHDVVLFYRSGESHTWNRPYVAHSEKHLRSHYRKVDAQGRRYEYGELTGPGIRNGRSGLPWRGFDVTGLGRHWTTTVDRLDELHAAGKIYVPLDGGWPRLIRYIDESKGRAVGDVWEDIPPINMRARERLGYPTQKPLALLERIISASTNPDDVVLDPFCGCGTSVDAAERLNRRWQGIDVTHYAVTLVEARLRANNPTSAFSIVGRPTDMQGAIELARRDKHQFQWWACWKIGSQTYRDKKGADRGVDGRMWFKNGPFGEGEIIISVKGGDNVQVASIRDLRGVIEREGAEMGVLITLAEPTRPMIAEASAAGFVERSAHGRLPRIQIVTVADLLEERFPVLPVRPQAPVHKRGQTRSKRDDGQMEMLLPLAGAPARIRKGDFLDPFLLHAGIAAG